jgi:pyruvate/2-oxoglutarate dehydrogenase complex dihydrolipoamide dehydrogenase (E3) component
LDTYRYDIVIIGGGSGGYAAARTARELGASVAIVDKGPLGGLCILEGCMPSKTLLATSDLLQEIREGQILGVSAGVPTVDMQRVIERKRVVIEGFASYRREQLETFPIHMGVARFESPTQLRVVPDAILGPEQLLEADRFIIATGSVISPVALPGLEQAHYFDSDDVLDCARLPKSVIVLGGGYVAAELGQFYARCGVETTFLLRSKQLLTGEDADVGGALTEYFRAEGIDVRTEVVLTHAEAHDGLKTIHYRCGDERGSVTAEEVFYALGRVPNVAGLHLERAGVDVHPISGIGVGFDMRTSNPKIFAVGDVNGTYPLVHVAIYQGEVAARNAVNGTQELADYRLQKTHTVFCDPQVAVTGETEKDLVAAGTPYLVASYPFADHGKAVAVNKTKGFVKIIASPANGLILGAAVIGPHASELIHEMIVAMHYNATVEDFMRIPHLHPTLAEIWTYPAEEIAMMRASVADEPVAATG